MNSSSKDPWKDGAMVSITKRMQMVLQEIQRMQQMIDDGIDIIHHD
ncbi:MAG: hypothetical protein ACLTCB_04395 [Merdibacter sp.]